LYDSITEIDLLIVTPSGIIIIENKHLSGNIFGDKKSQNWVQDKNGNIKEFYNPIKQNYGHFKCLLHHLKKSKIYGINITSLVIFSHDGGNLKVSDPFVYELESGVMAVKKLSAVVGSLDVKDITEKIKKMAKKYR
ncbi:MAG: nuclease-related domain-containing protein, partial [Acidaminobacteraceae bacterium]